jgi:hypothetical protein
MELGQVKLNMTRITNTGGEKKKKKKEENKRKHTK